MFQTKVDANSQRLVINGIRKGPAYEQMSLVDVVNTELITNYYTQRNKEAPQSHLHLQISPLKNMHRNT